MKFGIDMGHNAPPDVGASSRYGSEDRLTKEVGTQVINKLRAVGHEAVNCTPSSATSVMDSLRKRVNTANANNVDVYVSIHFNAFNGSANGTEVYAISSSGGRIAQPVLDNIVRLGFANRRVKDGAHLYVLRSTNMPAILIECCFIDSEKDMKLYNTEAMVNAIVQGLAGKLPNESSSGSTGGSTSGSTGGSTGGSTSTRGSDAQVLKLQKALNQLQIPDANNQALTEDGFTGPATESATQRFHQLAGINAAGRPVVLTWKALDEIQSQPILRPNHADGVAVRYLEYRLGAAIDGIYDDRLAEMVKTFQRQKSITVDGIVGPQTWGLLMGQPVPTLALKIIRDTVLKQEAIDSSQITDANLKYEIKEGEQLPLHSWDEEGNHVKAALLNVTFNGFNTWYAFNDHIEIWQDGQPLEMEPEDEAPQTNDRGDGFNLPGYTSTFFLSDPILPNGNFTWREALHNGERIPKHKSHVDNILALAQRLEDVRTRLGGFPMTVTSWYRPEPWNSRAGGAKYSRHKTGEAVDLLRSGMSGRQMASRLGNWPGGMGIYRSYPNLIHLDIRPYRARWGGA
ncbi:N-acetylmuramoyl-L-alanine amidase [Spirulina major CS-329]|uniref:N-acetylmuramoyl-L-alanine amidase n=1 Tax=Spirulina TaxID=1154 RepID=UPI00232C1B77|nr:MULTISPECIES: N-acetylmuramoyl-L-alanine amidase [Spirulina]MDB9493443.1 N-acetylmuramoyl-L-alanine amidase [Spirulina subsalsa CS-330]MDB9504731.1 N-acetylmuramoyl-L-alanine amidase [Spirulina major CS-329]